MNGGDHLRGYGLLEGDKIYICRKSRGRTYRRTIAYNTFSSALGVDQHSGEMTFEEEAFIILYYYGRNLRDTNSPIARIYCTSTCTGMAHAEDAFSQSPTGWAGFW